MGVTAERFNQGLTYQEYRDQMNRNQERFDETEAAVELNPDDVAAFSALEKPVNVMVIAEDWCGDVIAGLPVLGKLAAAADGKLNVRTFLRDQNLDLMDQYLKEGQFRSIPVFAFLDEDFNDLGDMKERPEAVTEMIRQGTAEIHAQHPEYGPVGTPADQMPEEQRVAYMQARNDLRANLRPQINQAIVDELRSIAKV